MTYQCIYKYDLQKCKSDLQLMTIRPTNVYIWPTNVYLTDLQKCKFDQQLMTIQPTNVYIRPTNVYIRPTKV